MAKTICSKVKKSEQDSRLKEMLNVIVSYAQLNFQRKIPIGNEGDDLDALGAGVNMLGEELNARVLSLKEKENMLKEIHHRVKNNLQIISSMLNIQVGMGASDEMKSFARESQSRIKTIALIHEMLYKSADFKHSNFKMYVETLIEMIRDTYNPSNQSINFDLNIDDDIFFDIDRLIPIGLIMNEAVSNSIKYAFPERNGQIKIEGKHKNSNILINISDDGVGLNKEFNMNKDSSMGIHLIHLLADQINMKVKMHNKVGVRYELSF